METTTVAIDLAKDVFQIALSDGHGTITARRRLTRRQFGVFVESVDHATTVVMESCEYRALLGASLSGARSGGATAAAAVRRPYVRRDKTDRADTDALLEAHRCAALHAVPVKTVDQQMIQGLHRVRQQWQQTRTGRINLLRGLLREHGLAYPTGRAGCSALAGALADIDSGIPPLLRATLVAVLDEVRRLTDHVQAIDRQLLQLARTLPAAQRLQQIPGVGVITATALIGSVPHIHAFRRGRNFASWLGLAPRESSSGARRSLGRISNAATPISRTCWCTAPARRYGVASCKSAGLQRTPRDCSTGRRRWPRVVAGIVPPSHWPTSWPASSGRSGRAILISSAPCKPHRQRQEAHTTTNAQRTRDGEPVGPALSQAALHSGLRGRSSDWLSVRGCPSWPGVDDAPEEAEYTTASDSTRRTPLLHVREESIYESGGEC